MDEKYDISHISRLRMGTDGKGIRTLILLYGCPLKCKYCLNPFTWDGTGKYERLSAREVYDRIALDTPYFLATEGGITFGGGEPLLQPQLINQMRALFEPEITINVETSLHVEWENIETVLDSVNVFYVDIKSTYSKVYQDYTGCSIDVVLENLKKLLAVKGADSVVVRIPEIPGFVDIEMQIKTKKDLENLGIKKFNLFKYKMKE